MGWRRGAGRGAGQRRETRKGGEGGGKRERRSVEEQGSVGKKKQAGQREGEPQKPVVEVGGSGGGAGKGWRSRCFGGRGDRRGVGVRRAKLAKEVAPLSCSAERYHVVEVFRGWSPLTALFSLNQERAQSTIEFLRFGR